MNITLATFTVRLARLWNDRDWTSVARLAGQGAELFPNADRACRATWSRMREHAAQRAESLAVR